MVKANISRRLKDIPASPIRKLASYADQAKKNGVRIIHLNIGDPDIKSPEVMINSLKKINQNPIPYCHSQGLSELLKALQWYYQKLGFNFISEKNIQITSGGSEAILMTLMAVADPGDEVIVFEPTYPNYLSFAKECNVKLVPVSTSIANHFHLPESKEIEKKITKRTRAILICSPNNPTGTIYTQKEIEMLVSLAKKHNLFLVADEVYREFTYDGRTHTSLLNYMKKMPDKIIVLDSLSKRYSVCGLRLGAIVTLNQEVLDGSLRIAQARLSVGYIDQFVASKLTEVSKKYFSDNIREYQERRNYICDSLSLIKGVNVYKPEGAFYLIVGLPVKSSEDFCRWLLTSFSLNGCTLMLAPAPGFYITKNLGKNEVRIAYVLNSAKLKIALDILKKGLIAYNKTS